MAIEAKPTAGWHTPTVKRRTALRLGGLAAVGLCTPAIIHSAQAADVIRIGTLTDLNGPASTDTGMPTVYAAQMAIDDFGGEVLGRKVQLLSADDQSKPDIGLTLARKWLDEDGATTIISNTLSSIGIGVKRLCVDRQKPFLVGTTASSVFTQEECSPLTVAFSVNTYSMPKGVVSALLAKGLDSWFFITADYAFGHALEADSTQFVTQSGGKVLGSALAPLATNDYSSFLLQAQSSGAKVVALAVQGVDFQNLIKQATEFGMGTKQTLAGLFVLDNQIIGAGLENAAGMVAAGAFYWDTDDATRAYSQRMMKLTGGLPPNGVQMAGYSAAMHYLRAVQAVGSTDGAQVVAQMKRMPINDFWSKDVKVREDGQALRPMHMMQVKSPAESKSRYDVFVLKEEIAPADAWRPLSQSACPFIRKAG
jgi:branched-chain amino acid transport system substrate-binding protein